MIFFFFNLQKWGVCVSNRSIRSPLPYQYSDLQTMATNYDWFSWWQSNFLILYFTIS